jgi:predicted DNA-binding protein
MEVHFTPELEKKLNDLAAQSGRPAAELVQDAVADMVDELAGTRDMLDRRYDDIKSGKVKLIPGDEAEAYFREKYAAARREQPGS